MISIVSINYYGMLRGQIHINLPPEHPIMSCETIQIEMAPVSTKRSILARTARIKMNSEKGRKSIHVQDHELYYCY